uniref:Uncharacterized protein n=1 Tax=Hemiselmis andersenii TaxID=464988 RepID=A0A6U4J7U5_HEMAN|mmetsp:Transcript_41577/g.97054  ORF Transcript_41577/g.97054 Transcript_41577/m.97054 type:complete len:204 (-) Transcript_41577:169-780(-)
MPIDMRSALCAPPLREYSQCHPVSAHAGEDTEDDGSFRSQISTASTLVSDSEQQAAARDLASHLDCAGEEDDGPWEDLNRGSSSSGIRRHSCFATALRGPVVSLRCSSYDSTDDLPACGPDDDVQGNGISAEDEELVVPLFPMRRRMRVMGAAKGTCDAEAAREPVTIPARKGRHDDTGNYRRAFVEKGVQMGWWGSREGPRC